MQYKYPCRPYSKKEITTINDRQVHCYNFLFCIWAASIAITGFRLKCVTGYAKMSNYLPDRTIRDKTKGNLIGSSSSAYIKLFVFI